MKKILVKSGVEIELGKRGEHLARCVVFDISDWKKTYGEGNTYLLHQRNGDNVPYPCVVEMNDNEVLWVLSEADVAVAGRGRAELQYFVGDARVKSETWFTRTDMSMINEGPVPEGPADSWIETMLKTGTEVEQNATVARESAEVAVQSEKDASAHADRAEEAKDGLELAQSNAEAAQQAAETAQQAAQTAQQEAETARDEAVTLKSETQTFVNETVSELTYELSVERARIDSFTTLADGSTTGDAELTDARVGADGVTYANLGSAVRGQVEDLRVGFYSSLHGRDLIEYITTPGCFRADTGAFNNSADAVKYYVRSNLIPLAKGELVRFRNLYLPSNFAVIGWYDKNKNFLGGTNGDGSAVAKSGYLTMPEDGYIRLGTSIGGKPYGKVEVITHKKELNILVLGNSFSQDSFAYLPPVLNEILPDYRIAYGVAYRSSADINDHIRLYYKECGTPQTDGTELKDGKYTWFNYWYSTATKWNRWSDAISAKNGKTLEEIMALKNWDIIYVQGTGSTSNPESNIIAPGRKLLRILQGLNGKPFSFITGQWLATSSNGDNGEAVFASMVTAMQTVKQNLGIRDYIPIGTAIQNARTNHTLQTLGDVGNMLYDNHMQSGIPALIATYTIALKILDCIGEAHRGIYGSTFEPTTANCVTIGAYKDGGMTAPLPMTHGDSVGVTTDNIRAAQEIAVLAVNNATTITDCSEILGEEEDI